MGNKSSQVVRCSSCNNEFIFYEGDDPSCPNCDADLLDLIVSLGVGWMLGDFLGFWGDDSE